MKKVFFACSLLFALFFSCKKPIINLLSETEKAGVTDVVDVFGSSVTWGRTLSTSTLEGNNTYFELRIDSLSRNITPYKVHNHMLSLNAAVLYYKHLTIEEKHSLTQVHVILPYEMDGVDTYIFRVGTLDTLVNKLALIDTVIVGIKNKDYAGVLSLLDRSLDQKTRKKFLTGASQIEPEFGNVTGCFPLGFLFYQREGEPEFARYYAVLQMSKQNINFSLDFYLDPAEQKISAFRFDHKF